MGHVAITFQKIMAGAAQRERNPQIGTKHRLSCVRGRACVVRFQLARQLQKLAKAKSAPTPIKAAKRLARGLGQLAS